VELYSRESRHTTTEVFDALRKSTRVFEPTPPAETTYKPSDLTYRCCSAHVSTVGPLQGMQERDTRSSERPLLALVLATAPIALLHCLSADSRVGTRAAQFGATVR